MALPPGSFNKWDIIAKINNPATDISQLLSQLQTQVNWSAISAAGDSYGTTSAARAPTKPIVIGFIPPDFVVNFVPVQKTNQSQSFAPAISQNVPKAVPGHAIPYPDSFYQKLSSIAQSIGARPEDLMAVLYGESGLDPGAKAMNPDGTVAARGLNGLTQVAVGAAGTTNDFWKTQYSNLSAEDQLTYVGNYFNSVSKGRTLPDAGSIYLANFAAGKLSQAGNPNSAIFSKDTDGRNYSDNAPYDIGNKGYISVGDLTTRVNNVKSSSIFKEYVAALNQALANQASGTGVPNPNTQSAQHAGAIMTNGNITDPNGQDPLNLLGRNIQVSDKRSAIVQAQVDRLNAAIANVQNLPSLVMLVNPQSFSKSYEHQVDAVKARRGYVVNMWLEKPVTISMKGVTAAQYAFRADREGGLTHFNRIRSISYKNLMSLVGIYRNNGHIYNENFDATDQMNAGTIQISMSAYIYYDGHIYIGSFDDFSITDSGNKPYNLEYNTKFTVRYDVDTTLVSDANIQRGLRA